MKWILITSLVLSVVFDAVLVVLNNQAARQPLPENVRDVYDEEEYQKFIRYRNDNKKLGTIKKTFEVAISLIFLISDLYAAVYQVLPGNEVSKTMLMLLVFEAISCVVSIPFEYYNTFVIEEKYGMNKSTRKTFFTDIIKQFIIGIIVTGVLLALAMFLFVQFGNLGILFAVFVIAFLVILVNLFSMKLMKIFNKFTPLEEGELRDSLQELCDKYGMQVKAISIMDASKRTTRANAFCAGIGNKKDISLDDNLVERYTTKQIVAVFAHEFAHAKFKHMPKQMLINILQIALYVMIVGVILNFPQLFTAFGFKTINYYFALILFGMIAWPITAVVGLILNYFSRKCEYEADAFSAKEGYGAELISALKQLSKDSLSNLNPHPVIVALEYSHPTISQRATAIEQVNKLGTVDDK